MIERKHKRILSLNLKKLANCADDLKITLILQNEMLLLMLFCKRVFKQREDIPRYGEAITGIQFNNKENYQKLLHVVGNVFPTTYICYLYLVFSNSMYKLLVILFVIHNSFLETVCL